MNLTKYIKSVIIFDTYEKGVFCMDNIIRKDIIDLENSLKENNKKNKHNFDYYFNLLLNNKEVLSIFDKVIDGRKSIKESEISILFRSNTLRTVFEEYLIRNNVIIIDETIDSRYSDTITEYFKIFDSIPTLTREQEIEIAKRKQKRLFSFYS